jgi:hypothetical protein
MRLLLIFAEILQKIKALLPAGFLSEADLLTLQAGFKIRVAEDSLEMNKHPVELLHRSTSVVLPI